MMSKLLPELPLVLPPISDAMCGVMEKMGFGYQLSFNPSSTIYLLYTLGKWLKISKPLFVHF